MYASPIFAHSNPILKQEAGEGSSGPQDLQAAISAPRSPTPKPKQATPRFTKRAKTHGNTSCYDWCHYHG